MAYKRDAAALSRLLKKYGDIKLSEALQKVRNPINHRPQKWGLHTRIEVFLGVEAMRAAGLKVTQAWKEFAKYSSGLFSVNTVENLHSEGRERFGPIFEGYESEILRLHLEGNGALIKGNPTLKAICDKIKKGAAKTPAIR